MWMYVTYIYLKNNNRYIVDPFLYNALSGQQVALKLNVFNRAGLKWMTSYKSAVFSSHLQTWYA